MPHSSAILMRVPPFIAAVCAGIYWLTVLIKCIRIAPRIGKDPNVLPREPVGRLMRLIWVPVIGIWIVSPWLRLRDIPPSAPWPLAGACGAALCIAALALTFHCWHQMGNSWRIGIDPNEKTCLVVRGAFSRMRHPIYALSILLMLGTLAAAPSRLLAAAACAHILLVWMEAIREEKYLLRLHGEAYRDYSASTGRFFPRLRS